MSTDPRHPGKDPRGAEGNVYSQGYMRKQLISHVSDRGQFHMQNKKKKTREKPLA